MKRLFTTTLMLAALAAPTLLSAAEPLDVNDNDTIASLLLKQKGKSVTLRLKDGGEMSGQVRSVGSHTVHLGALSGREFFDGVIVLDDVSALIVRTRDR